MQQKALEKIRNLGLPTRKSEDWHYFPVAKLSTCKSLNFIGNASDFSPIDNAEESNNPPSGAFCETDFGIDCETDFSALLPIAMGAKCFFKEIAPCANESGILKAHDEFSHSAFRIGTKAKVSLEILENKLSRSLSAERLDFFVGEDAELELFFSEEGHSEELKFRNIRIHQEKGSKVHILDFNRSKALWRFDIQTSLLGETAEFGFRALNILNGSANGNDFVRVAHLAPQCKSRQFVRNLLSDNATLNYDGGVTAAPLCPGTDSSELINTMLLSDEAKIQVKPTLKIYHDDVACSHGNTVGALDAESIFYLQSRGIAQERATELLLRAFAKELLAEHPNEATVRRFDKLLDSLHINGNVFPTTERV